MNERVLDFSKNPVLPEAFKNVAPRHVIYAAGDAFGGFNKQGPMDITNIEAFSKEGYTIFCCIKMNDTNENIVYLNNHKELNIVVCMLTGDDENDYNLLIQLFRGSIDLINTDDRRFYPDSKTSFEMLKPGGKCINVARRFLVGQTQNNSRAAKFYKFNSGWAKPNFEMEKQGNVFTLTKTGGVFNDNTNTKNLRAIQEVNNSRIANNLRQSNAEKWTMKGGKLTSSSKTRKRRALKRK